MVEFIRKRARQLTAIKIEINRIRKQVEDPHFGWLGQTPTSARPQRAY